MIKGRNILLKPMNTSLVDSMLELEIRNKEFFIQYAPDRDPDYYTYAGQLKRMEAIEENWVKDLGYGFAIYLHDNSEPIGSIGLFNIKRGPSQTAMVGYSLDQEHNGKGYATEALRLIVDFAFDQLNLHRVEAEVMPSNIGSIKILERTGFHKEGIAKQNVRINGKWEDHQVLAILNDHFEE